MEQNQSLKHFWIYVLLLEQGKYYVGVTSQKNPQARINQHLRFFGAAWTRKFKPIETLELYELGDMTYEQAQAIENKKVREYIKQFGIEKVRGGDISMTEPLQKFFGCAMRKTDIKAFKIMLFLLFGFATLLVLYILK